MLKHIFNADKLKKGSYQDITIQQTANDKVVSEWEYRNNGAGQESNMRFRVSLIIGENKKPIVMIEHIDDLTLMSREICRMLYNTYYKGIYKQKEITFRFKASQNDEWIEPQMAPIPQYNG